MIVLGIDPGLGGALALVDCASGGRPFLVAARDVPTVGEDARRRVFVGGVLEWIFERKVEIDVAYIERAQAMPDQGASSGFIYGRAVGALEATVLCAGVRLKTAEPAVWKRRFGLTAKQLGTGPDEFTKRKAASRALAIRNIDGAKEKLELAKDHNKAEAMLIAVFGAMLEHAQPTFPVGDLLQV